MAVADRLHRASAVLRVILILNLLALTAWGWSASERPVAVGPDGAEPARLAGEQEARLRTGPRDTEWELEAPR